MKSQQLKRRKDVYRWEWFAVVEYSDERNRNKRFTYLHPAQFFGIVRTHNHWVTYSYMSDSMDKSYQTSTIKAYLEKIWNDIKPEVSKDEEWVRYLFYLRSGSMEKVIEHIKEFYPDFDPDKYAEMLIRISFTWQSLKE